MGNGHGISVHTGLGGGAAAPSSLGPMSRAAAQAAPPRAPNTRTATAAFRLIAPNPIAPLIGGDEVSRRGELRPLGARAGGERQKLLVVLLRGSLVAELFGGLGGTEE